MAAKKAKKAPKRAAAKKSANKSAPRKAAKAKKVQAIPAGYRTVTPYLVVEGVGKLMDWLKAALGAKERYRATMPDGSVMHGEIKIGDSMVMLGEAKGEHKPNVAMIYLYVKDCDKLYAQAIKAGAESIMPPTNQFYGDRSGGVKDPNGNQWWIGTHVEDVSPKELHKRMLAFKGH
jgi:PhnB protein